MTGNNTEYTDPVTTFRTDANRLPPFSDAFAIENDDARAMRIAKMTTGDDSPRAVNMRLLLKTNPWLVPILRELADARLRMYSSAEDDKRYRSKDYGWAHKLDYITPPESDYFTFAQNEDGDWVIKDLGNAKGLDVLAYGVEKKPFEDYLKKPFNQSFQPMTRKEADAEGLDWYPTSNELLNALIKTKLGDGNKQALYDAAQFAFTNAWKEDLDSEEPKYSEASKHLYDGDKDTSKHQYEIPNGVSSFVKNMFMPMSNAVLEDPELNFKTTPLEHVARGAGDLALLFGSAALPWLGASRAAALTARPLIGAAVGGAAGGLANYGVQRLMNTGLAEATGHGYIDQPIDATDAGIEMALGALSGPISAANKLRGLNALKMQMWKERPSGVTSKHINQSIALSKAKGSTDRAMQPFLSQAFEKFNKKYPDTQFKVDLFPNPSDVPPNSTKDFPLLMNKPNGRFVGTRGKGVDADKSVLRTNIGDIPLAYTDPTPEFLAQYVKNNEPFFKGKKWFNSLGEDTYGLKPLLKAAQVKGSPESKLFTGETMIKPMSEHAELLSQWRGNNLLGEEKNLRNQALRKLFKGAEAVDMSTGSAKPLPKSQQKAYKKAMDEYKKRTDMKLVTEADLKEASKSGLGSQMLRKVAVPLGIKATDNALPWGSSMIMGVEPYTYDYNPNEGVDKK